MLNIPKEIIQKSANLFGYTITKVSNFDPIIDEDKKFRRIYSKSKKFTMTSKERMYTLYKSVEYIIKNNIPGDFVECGVWRAGSTMLVAYTLLELNIGGFKLLMQRAC